MIKGGRPLTGGERCPIRGDRLPIGDGTPMFAGEKPLIGGDRAETESERPVIGDEDI